jgi:hypothetical protein
LTFNKETSLCPQHRISLNLNHAYESSRNISAPKNDGDLDGI